MIRKNFFLAGAILGFWGVAFGAFGAHALKNQLTPEMRNIFEVGVRYQIFHALALLITALTPSARERFIHSAGNFFMAGTVLFSGSLYVLALSGQKFWGMITPVGGMLLLAGWLSLILLALKNKS